MKVTIMRFRQEYQFFFGYIGKSGFVLYLFILFCLAGCGEENIEPRHYSPASALPLRVDATATPVSPSTQHLEDQEEAYDEETGQNTPILLSDSTQVLETPTPEAEDTSEETSTPEELSPTPTPVLTPTNEKSTPTPIPQKTKVVPTPTPTSTPKPTTTPKGVKSTPQNTKKAENSNELPNNTHTDAEQSTTQVVSKQQTKKFTPIITPYDITIDQLAVCSKVSNRNPVNCGEEFSLSKTGRIYTWMKVSGVKPPKVVKHIYYWKGALIATVKLKLKYSSMRTWSQKTFKPSQALGKWKVVITTEKDEIITVKEFTVVQ